jgi:uncharacterized protein YhfF
MSDETMGVCEFAFPGPLRDRLVAAVLRGAKTATTALEGEPLPRAGDRQAVIKSDGSTACVIELLRVSVLRLADVDLTTAVAEGEGFRDVAHWRADHEQFWNQEVRPSVSSIPPLTDDTPVLVQWFRVISPDA